MRSYETGGSASLPAVLALAPLAAPWLERGLSELEVRTLLTAGLPPTVHSPRALLADRLARKLPAPRPRRDAAAPAASLAECGECRDPLPRGQQSGICATCAGAGGRSVASPAVDEALVADRVASLRAVLRGGPTPAAA
ncbi:hypothetical protein J1792_23055 [Streptomyces triculaminicus]|uniref:Uncharacterized protein n=1 Tax=Streptomyces triculaminicus TaxID=2816232 RepID=A0A939FRV0_9ACTN|nr:hypothetical protein [Streptomyces triculaminicus]MBO0655551.1 hypothetical protein [Streptomyces triculaminicus]